MLAGHHTVIERSLFHLGARCIWSPRLIEQISNFKKRKAHGVGAGGAELFSTHIRLDGGDEASNKERHVGKTSAKFATDDEGARQAAHRKGRDQQGGGR